MCGIVGFFSPRHQGNSKPLIEGLELLKHRGPNDSGFWLRDNVGLGSTRLSIQDLSSKGKMPMNSQCGRYVITYNGEIYNFKKIRKSLINKGLCFKTKTDTEVILNLYKIKGEKCLDQLNGMFSIAIYDKEKKSLFIARDRYGIKPLYYYKSNDFFLFASEIKAFIPFVKFHKLSWEIEQNAISEQLLFRYNSGDITLVKNCKRLLPGHRIILKNNNIINFNHYYKLIENRKKSYNRSFKESINLLERKLKKSVKYRLISDAPVGIALSGGLDSSIVTALASQRLKNNPKTFSITFNKNKLDESKYSDFIAKKYETSHHKILLTKKNFFKLLPKCVWFNDEPLNHPNSIGMYLLSKYASKHVKVLLGGEGADEIFSGYNFFKKKSFYHLKNRMIRVRDVYTLTGLSNYQNEFKKKLILNKTFNSKLNREIYFNIYTYLQTIQNRADKMSMANSIEMRMPFLDKNIVEMAMKIPDNFKLSKNKETKYILKELAGKYFPIDFIKRPKVGFSIPINEWLRDKKSSPRIIEMLLDDRTLDRPYFDADGLRLLIKKFKSGQDSFNFSLAGRIWILLSLELWSRTFIDDMAEYNFSFY